MVFYAQATSAGFFRAMKVEEEKNKNKKNKQNNNNNNNNNPADILSYTSLYLHKRVFLTLTKKHDHALTYDRQRDGSDVFDL